MNNNGLNKFSDRKISNKQLIAPFIALFMFLAITGGVSYAYFNFNSNSTNNTTYLNANFPARGCSASKAFTISKQDCSQSITMDMMKQSASSNSTPASNDTCYVKATISGCTGDTCTYNVVITPVVAYNKSRTCGTTTTRSPALTLDTGVYEFGAELKLGATTLVSKANMDSFAGTGTSAKTLVSSQSVTVGASNASASKQYDLELTWYNLNADQTGILSTTSACTYKYKLSLSSVSCDFGH